MTIGVADSVGTTGSIKLRHENEDQTNKGRQKRLPHYERSPRGPYTLAINQLTIKLKSASSKNLFKLKR